MPKGIFLREESLKDGGKAAFRFRTATSALASASFKDQLRFSRYSVDLEKQPETR